jgi:hypothetical protein
VLMASVGGVRLGVDAWQQAGDGARRVPGGPGRRSLAPHPTTTARLRFFAPRLEAS